jgi:hypothetical protein
MNRKLTIIVVIQALIIVMLFWVLVFYGKDEYEALIQASEEEITMPNRVSAVDGQAIISINQDAQQQSEIKTSTLQPTSYAENIASYGNVVSIASLIELRSHYLAADADILITQSALSASKKEFERFNALNQDNKNIADKVVTAAQTEVNTQQAKLLAAQANTKSIADSMRQQWGIALTQLAMQKEAAPLFNQLIQNSVALVQITLPFHAHTPVNGSQIKIAPTSALSQIVSAQYFSPAPASNLTMQGKTYFYYAKADFLRAGMPIKVLNFNKLGKPIEGVIIPNSAVIWYAGKPWLYHKLNATQFKRLPIDNDHEIDGGWFYQGKLTPKDQIVTSGAQLLLSEEFKSQITNENDD